MKYILKEVFSQSEPSTMIFIIFGAICLIVSIFNVELWLENKNVRWMSYFLGKTGTRIFYGVVGLFFLLYGLL